jgi:hypothetical protein
MQLPANAPNPDPPDAYRIALLQWEPDDGITEMIADELAALGHWPMPFQYGATIPAHVDIIISHGPHGKLLPFLYQAAETRCANGPTIVHWNTEGLPDLRLPSSLMWAISGYRSRVGRLSLSKHDLLRKAATRPPVAWIDNRTHRFRYAGDYAYAYRKGLLDILADSSQIYAHLFSQQGIPTIHVPWGTNQRCHADLALERDIDVLWMGKRGTRRRSELLDRVRRELRSRGIDVYAADNEEHPFIFREVRTQFLNRAKITLNLARTWYDDNYSRFAFAIPNRSLVVSEPILPHCPAYQAGVHYVSAPIDKLAETVAYYLAHDGERQALVENAYKLATTTLTFRNSMARLMESCRRA